MTEPLRVARVLSAPHGLARAHLARAALLSLPFAERCRSRLRTALSDGREVALILPRGTVLREGDVLVTEDGELIRIEASPQALLEIRSADPLRLAQAAYHLGNRHIRIELGGGYLRLEDDPVLGAMLEGLGLQVERIAGPFDPEPGAYGGGHRHGHDSSFAEDYALAQSAYAHHEIAQAANSLHRHAVEPAITHHHHEPGHPRHRHQDQRHDEDHCGPLSAAAPPEGRTAALDVRQEMGDE